MQKPTDPKQVILKLLENNKKYVDQMKLSNPDHFTELSKIQKPDYLFIGCADSRVPANEIMGLKSGEVFVHRNIANLVSQSDFNCLSVVQYAVDHLKVKNILIVGHYGCGGVKVSLLEQNDLGLFQNWTKQIKDLRELYRDEMQDLDEDQIHRKMCELNVVWQVKNLCQSTVIQAAWQRGENLSIHGLIYDLKDGILKDLQVHMDDLEKFKKFQKDLWQKKFHPQPKDLFANVPEEFTPQQRMTIFRTMSMKIEYHSDASRDDSDHDQGICEHDHEYEDDDDEEDSNKYSRGYYEFPTAQIDEKTQEEILNIQKKMEELTKNIQYNPKTSMPQ